MVLVREWTIPIYRHLSAKLAPTFADKGVPRSKRGRPPMAVNSVF
jgi:hypothetical protein